MHRTMTPLRQVSLPLGGTLAIAVVVTIAVVLLAATPAFAAPPLVSTGDGSWVWQRPLPQGNDLNDVAFADDVRGWSVGDAGTILRSDDGGATWTGDRSDTGVDLLGVGVADAQSAWAVGASGTIVATSDGGATWKAQASGVRADLHAVTALTSDQVWIAGSGGVVLHTGDGGATWTRQTTGSVADLHAVEFVDAGDGWVSGAGGALLHTSDGGATWSAQDWAGTSGYPADQVGRIDLRAVSFVDAQTGWATGGWGLDWNEVVFVHTTDGGRTWTALPDTMDFSYTSDIEFVDGDHGWVVTQNQEQPDFAVEVSRTSDGGQSWSRTWGPAMSFDEFERAFPVSLAVGDDGRAWLAGPVGRLSRSLDGRSWTSITGNHRGWLDDVTFADPSTGWAAGSDHSSIYGAYGAMLKTTDGGETWIDAGIGACGPLYAVACRGTDHVMAVGFGAVFVGDGNVVYTHDGGATWQTAWAGGGQLNDVDLATADRGWTVSRDGGVYRSDDGGASWLRQTPASPLVLEAVDFVDGDHGWVVGDSGTIMSSTDGGADWEAQTSGTSSALNDVAFGDRFTGWAVGAGGTVLHTSDGGRTWTPVAVGDGADFSAVTVAGETVMIAGAGGTVMTSDDAGVSWRVEATGTRTDLTGLAMIASRRAWVVGGKGVILATSDDQSDTTPPTTADDAPSGWVDHDVTVSLRATDDASGVARTEYRLDGGPWTTGSQVVVAATPDHSNDGAHAIAYRSVDVAGNVEADNTCDVSIDTRAPSVVASPIVFARQGRPGILACTALDPEPNGGSVTVRATGIRTSRRHPWSASATTTPGGVARLALPDGLSRGAYRVLLSARDAAGNSAATPVVVLLVVR